MGFTPDIPIGTKYWIPGEGISEAVLKEYVSLNGGPKPHVLPLRFEGKDGYLLTTTEVMTSAQISDLRIQSSRDEKTHSSVKSLVWRAQEEQSVRAESSEIDNSKMVKEGLYKEPPPGPIILEIRDDDGKFTPLYLAFLTDPGRRLREPVKVTPPDWYKHAFPEALQGPAALVIGQGTHLELRAGERLPYEVLRSLGTGGSAEVEMVRDVNSNAVYARKMFKNVHARQIEDAKKHFQNELQVLGRLSSHHHIVRVFATYVAQRTLALILTPVADRGDLAAFLQQYRDAVYKDPRDTALLQQAIGCLASALAFMHQQTVRHKDIKPKNILVHQGSVLYTDFGIALDFSQQEASTTRGRPNGFSARYCAPEVADYGDRNSKSDVFSLGCVYVEIVAALEPALISDALLEGPFHLTLDELPGFDIVVPDESKVRSCVVEVIRKILREDSKERPSAKDVVGMLPDRMWFCQLCFEVQKDEDPADALADTMCGATLKTLNFSDASQSHDQD